MNVTDGNMPDTYDRMIGALNGLPDVVSVKPATVRTSTPLLGTSQTFIVQTMRQSGSGDHIFLEMVDREGSMRIVLPPLVADCVARQRESLTRKNRSKGAKRAAADRMARGELPGFMKNKTNGKAAKK